MGPLMLDLSGYELTGEEIDMLDHPLVGGVILFSRNYHDPKQLTNLVQHVRNEARNKLLIAVDHEGGRVQRFRHGFSTIPAMGTLYSKVDGDLQLAEHYSHQFGWLMAAELIRHDIDLSFAPVLDIHGVSDVIGDRSFHAKPDVIVALASGFINGMHLAGMKATGKHFPGHGNVKEDSHIAMPVDSRPKQQIIDHDLEVFAKVHRQGLLDAVMPAHVIYSEVDSLPAGFSPVWIQQYLRNTLKFDGVVFSDDLSMQGAAQIGDFGERAKQALHAGCDMLLVCNDSKASAQVLDTLPADYPASHRIPSMAKLSNITAAELEGSAEYQTALRELEKFNAC